MERILAQDNSQSVDEDGDADNDDDGINSDDDGDNGDNNGESGDDDGDNGDDDDGNNYVDDGYDGEAKTTVMSSNLLCKSESHLWKRINLRFDLDPRHLHSKEEAEWQYPQRLDI